MALHMILKEKRKELGLTQEQIANYLGVSTPAVSKWERGSTYPDVTLLPALARLLKTDLNTLLCFEEELSSKEIALFLNDIAAIIEKKGFDEGYSASMEKIRAYPSDAELLHSLALVLQGSLMMADLSAEEKQIYDDKIASLYERVAHYGDMKYTERANYMLASHYIQKSQFDKAQELLDQLPEPNALDKRSLQANLWMKQEKYEDAANLYEQKLRASLQDMQLSLAQLISISIKNGDGDTAAKLSESCRIMNKTFGLWDLGSYLGAWEYAVSMQNKEDAISTLNDMLQALLTPWDPTESFIYKHVKTSAEQVKPASVQSQSVAAQPVSQTDKENRMQNVGLRMLPVLLTDLETNPEYAFLRNEPEFNELLEQYKQKVTSTKR
ncbi:MAG: helix-turn-helix domain-containing protein [Lachnospiraceae bacterium]|nr:helix-turn-helix domain-containing protein [Lachnospiraceae bacterium]